MMERLYLVLDESSDNECDGLIFIGKRDAAQDRIGELVNFLKKDYGEDKIGLYVLRYKLLEVTMEEGMIIKQEYIDI